MWKILEALLVLSVYCIPNVASGTDQRKPVPIIFDTDMGNDCDDVLALSMVHALQARGECRLLAVTITKDHKLAAPFVDCINTFYGRDNVPVGVCRSGIATDVGKFNGLAETKDGGRFRYPHDLRTGQDARTAVDVLRKTLADADDQSVVVIQVGFSSNLAGLLASSADAHSGLDGISLVRQKVRLLSVMAGAFQQIPGTDGRLHDHIEYNVMKDLPSSRQLCDKWPTSIVWSGFEVGLNLRYPHRSILEDYRYVEHHPVVESYMAHSPSPHDRPTWDLTSVLYAVRPGRGYFNLSQPGRVKIQSDGRTTFEPADDGRDRYLVIRDAQKARTTEAFVQLSSQPPRHR